jgi:diguanylate cyclase (GGDEF)-like protein
MFMMIASDALVRARNAHAAQKIGGLESSLPTILDALIVIALEGNAEQFREVESLLDIELFVSGRHSEAIAPVLTAKAFASERGERWIVATCARRLAWSYDFSGDDVAAIESLDEAAQEFEALKDRAAVARCLNSKGVLWTRRGDREESLRVLREALVLVDALGDMTERIRVRSNLGHSYQLLHLFAEGRQVLEEANTIGFELNSPIRAVALLNLTRLELTAGNIEQATVTLQRIEPELTQDNPLLSVEVLLLRGLIAATRADFTASVEHFQAALALTQSLQAFREQLEIWHALSQTHASAGNYQAAYQAMDQANKLDASLRRERTLLQVATVSARRTAEKAQRETEMALARESDIRETLTHLEQAKCELELAAEKNYLLVAELERQTREDPLTGLMNRRALSAELSRELVRTARYERPLAVALLDIDNFKSINDQFSHATGDAVLVAVARALMASRRVSDLVARLGGEEMVIVFPETGPEEALQACEAMRSQLAAVDWAEFGLDRTVTASIGLTSYRKGDTEESLLHRADQAMYAAKRSGKDRVTVT